MDHGELKDEGFFSGDFVDKALSQFCFMSIIQVNSLYYDHSKKHRNCMLHTLYLLFTAV